MLVVAPAAQQRIHLVCAQQSGASPQKHESTQRKHCSDTEHAVRKSRDVLACSSCTTTVHPVELGRQEWARPRWNPIRHNGETHAVLRLIRRAPTKMMQGCSFSASEKVACTSFCVSPNHLLCSMLGRTLMKLAPDSFASACAHARRRQDVSAGACGGPPGFHPGLLQP